MSLKSQLKEIRNNVWELPKTAKKGMRVPARLFLSKKLLNEVEEGAIEQIANVAFLPGIYKHSIALPDMHFGYGFPIGGVAALDFENGGLSPGGIGFDINCGVRLLRTNITVEEIKPKIPQLLESIFNNVPSGVGRGGKLRLSFSQLKDVLEEGAKWAVKEGYGIQKDLEHLEEKGCLAGADASKVSDKALKRGSPQLGTLGAGNHFLEIQRVEKIFLPNVAKAFGIEKENQITIMIHTGSRGLGHQICTDYLQILERVFRDKLKQLPDRELVYAPSGTKECNDYFAAMACGANYAWTNRQLIMHWIRESIYKTLEISKEDANIQVVYDVAHNVGKIEEHDIDGKKTKVYIHRKGATRAFGPNAEDIPSDYKNFGQPVIVPGSMGTASYVLVGTKTAEEETFSSVCHGAGRQKSRHQALKSYRGEQIKRTLGEKDILVRAASLRGIAEEAPGAYKDVDEVVRVCQAAGIAKIVAKMRPMGVIKG
jgi:tRNA-splicing ligase RtcB